MSRSGRFRTDTAKAVHKQPVAVSAHSGEVDDWRITQPAQGESRALIPTAYPRSNTSWRGEQLDGVIQHCFAHLAEGG